MHLHEYQAKALFAEYGVPVPEGRTANSAEEAVACAEALGGAGWVVKAQVHAGGRGKAGGVRLVKSPREAGEVAQALLGTRLVTHQTTAEGQPIDRVLVETTSTIARELYLALLVDRASKRILFMASAAGGMDIEKVAAQSPEKIITQTIPPAAGLQPFHARRLGYGLGLTPAQIGQLAKIMDGLYRLFTERDLSLVEINPLIVTGEGQLLALDGKINVDENGLYRQKGMAALRDPRQEDEAEAKANEFQLNYVKLDGDIGCMVNGAGLAMATMDLIKLHGGEPANFLDVGGGTTAERVAEAFKLILADGKVKAVLVNIFGGIVRCDLIAEGIIKAVREVGVAIPVVVRLEGTNVEQGRAMLAGSGLALAAASDLTDAATQVVAAARGN